SFALATGDRSHFLLRVGNRDRLTGPGRGRAPVHLERDADRDRVGPMTQKRIPSAVDAVAEDYVDDMLALSPSLALYLGLDGATASESTGTPSPPGSSMPASMSSSPRCSRPATPST